MEHVRVRFHGNIYKVKHYESVIVLFFVRILKHEEPTDATALTWHSAEFEQVANKSFTLTKRQTQSAEE